MTDDSDKEAKVAAFVSERVQILRQGGLPEAKCEEAGGIVEKAVRAGMEASVDTKTSLISEPHSKALVALDMKPMDAVKLSRSAVEYGRSLRDDFKATVRSGQRERSPGDKEEAFDNQFGTQWCRDQGGRDQISGGGASNRGRG